MPEESPTLPALSPPLRLSGGRRTARGFLSILGILSAVTWITMVRVEILGGLALLAISMLGQKADPVIGAILGLIAVDAALIYYQRRGYLEESRQPRTNRLILILTILSVVLGSALLIQHVLPLIAPGPLQCMTILLALRGPVVLASGLPYLLNRIPWHDNLPPQR